MEQPRDHAALSATAKVLHNRQQRWKLPFQHLLKVKAHQPRAKKTDKSAFLAAHLWLMLHVSYTWNGKSVRTKDKKEERESEYKAAQCSIDVVIPNWRPSKAYLCSSFHCHSTCSTIYKIKNVSQPRDTATNTFVTITNTHICIYIYRKKIQNPPSLKNKEQIHVYNFLQLGGKPQ